MTSVIEIPTGIKISTQTFINPENAGIEKPETQLAELSAWHLKHEESVISLTQWLSQSKVITNLNYRLESLRAPGKNEYRVILNFALAEKYVAHFILLKGLFEFNNIKAVKVIADKTARTFSLEVMEDIQSQVVTYVETIFNLLVKEINFKTILRGIIKLEERIKREQALAYGALKASV